MSREQQMIFDLLKEMREDIKGVSNDQKNIREEIFEIKQTNLENHLNWVEHKRNTEALEKIVDQQGIRIEKLEEPVKVKQALTKSEEEAIKLAELKNKRIVMVISTVTAILSLLAAVAKLKGWV